ncbi:hypothetical protein H310_08943 [Aphanomyces invadans]|uniref:Uncharacterized protein n=1 Tax=Aphanomyces invadans TaxID=157072 RepID=A0A024TVN0_9STRA|nr:hypothetical protein H310_08943 [Aphanomyces invadans]ETV98220.1 hypothetical protein H310_08943 [Aphanomyces invadans]|eukprot:XP_008873095.1 hypothetical protein H310_08943 [Aphanomyces invadans]
MPIAGSIRLRSPLPPASSFKGATDALTATAKVVVFRPSTPPSELHRPPPVSLSTSPDSPLDAHQPMLLKSPRATNRELVSLESWPTDDIDVEVAVPPPSSASSPTSSASSSSLASSTQSPPPRPGSSTTHLSASVPKRRPPQSDRDAWSNHGGVNAAADAAMSSMAHMMRGGSPPPNEDDLLPLWERPPQVVLESSPQKMDPEMRVFHDAFAQRRQTVRVATAPSPPRKAISLPQHGAARTEAIPVRPQTAQTFTSLLRVCQMGEIDEIRLAFQRHNLSFQNQVFERALLIPEDKTTAECIGNLPLPGSRLPENPITGQLALLFKINNTGTKSGKRAKKAKKKAKKKTKKNAKKLSGCLGLIQPQPLHTDFEAAGIVSDLFESFNMETAVTKGNLLEKILGNFTTRF